MHRMDLGKQIRNLFGFLRRYLERDDSWNKSRGEQPPFLLPQSLSPSPSLSLFRPLSLSLSLFLPPSLPTSLPIFFPSSLPLYLPSYPANSLPPSLPPSLPLVSLTLTLFPSPVLCGVMISLASLRKREYTGMVRYARCAPCAPLVCQNFLCQHQQCVSSASYMNSYKSESKYCCRHIHAILSSAGKSFEHYLYLRVSLNHSYKHSNSLACVHLDAAAGAGLQPTDSLDSFRLWCYHAGEISYTFAC